MMFLPLLKDPKRYVFVTTLFAILLQIQVTLFASDEYSGIRVNSADFLIPPLGLLILISLAFKDSDWPRWKAPFGYWCIILLTAVMCYGLLNGYLLHEEVIKWALLNKFCGWFVLCAYLCAGGWLVTNSPKPLFKYFYFSFVGSFLLLSFISVLQYILFWEYDLSISGAVPLFVQGFMFNRNAYAFLFLTVILLCIFSCYGGARFKKQEKWLHLSLLTLLPLLLYFNASRALWLCFILLLPVAVIYYRTVKLKTVMTCLLLGCLCLTIALPKTLPRGLQPIKQIILLFVDEDDKGLLAKDLNAVETYNNDRFDRINDSLDLIKKHPLRGAGLGEIMRKQRSEGAEVITVLDNTPLWILTEFGPFGLLAFGIVYFAIIRSFMIRKEKNTKETVKFGIALLAIFALFSLVHEILYTRFLWFILGLLLAEAMCKHEVTEKQPR